MVNCANRAPMAGPTGMIAVAFFGFYLWGVDSILGLIFSTLEGWLKQ